MTTKHTLLEEAIAHHEANRFEAAEHLYQALLALEPEHAEAHYNLGVLELEQGKAGAGLEHLQRALELAPERGQYWLGLAQGMVVAERPEDALIVLDRAEAMGLDSDVARELRTSIKRPLNDGEHQDRVLDASVAPSQSVDSISSTPEVSAAGEADSASTFMVTLSDGVRVCVPATLECPTTYLLLEHEDWPDPALAFIRALIQPDMLILDVGAGHGVHALTMANRLSGRGKVIALESSSRVAKRLARAIEENGLGDVLITMPLELSDRCGEGRIALDVFGQRTCQEDADSSQSVKMLTLKALIEEDDWPSGVRLDVLRLDASVEQAAILEAGVDVLAAQTPIVMLEIAPNVQLGSYLLEILARCAMQPYRLIPGLNALVPLEQAASTETSPKRSTVFACGPARAASLRQRSLMV